MKMMYTALEVSGIKVGSESCSMSRSSMRDCILASMALNKSDTGSHRYTLMYRVSHWCSVDWKPSQTEIAKAIGPSIERTIRKKVLMVSMTRAAAWNRISSSSRNAFRISCFSWYIPRSRYIPDMVARSEGDQPSSSSWRSNSSSDTRYAVSGLRSIASCSSWSFCACSVLRSSTCPSSIPCVPVTTGLSTAFIVPSTIVGKNMIHNPKAKGLSSGNISIGSARLSACQTFSAT